MAFGKLIGIGLFMLTPSVGASCTPQPPMPVDLAVSSCWINEEGVMTIEGKALPAGVLDAGIFDESELDTIPVGKFVWRDQLKPDCLDVEAESLYTVYVYPKCCDVISVDMASGKETFLCTKEATYIGLSEQ